MSIEITSDRVASRIFDEVSDKPPRKETPRSLELYRIQALRACKDLGYSKEIFRRVISATNEIQIERIMRTAALKEL